MYKKDINIAIFGLGTVGSSLVKLITKEKKRISNSLNLNLNLVSISSRKLPQSLVKYKKIFTKKNKLYEDKNVDVVIELIGGIDVAYEFVSNALINKKHVITANKELIATKGSVLMNLAKKNKCKLFFEASVAGAIPILKSIYSFLKGNDFKRIVGILNGTSNYILTDIFRNKTSFNESLSKAQKLGYAEADPAFDIEGTDVAHKLVILSSMITQTFPKLSSFEISGIKSILNIDLQVSYKFGYSIKLLGIIEKSDDHIFHYVGPQLITDSHIISNTNGVMNGILVDSYPSGQSYFYGHGAGGLHTSSAILSDLLNLQNEDLSNRFSVKLPKKIKSLRDYIPAKIYIRVEVNNSKGILSKVTEKFSLLNLSVEKVDQHLFNDSKKAFLLFILVNSNKTSIKKIKLKFKRSKLFHNLEIFPIVDIKNV